MPKARALLWIKALHTLIWVVFAGSILAIPLPTRVSNDQAFLYAFDLLELDGEDWRPRPLEERKAKLRKLLTGARAGIQFSEHLDGDGAR